MKTQLSSKKRTINQPNYSPWAPLSYILDQVEHQGILHNLRWDTEGVPPRRVVEDFLRFMVMNQAQVGIDQQTGELMVRAALHEEKTD